MNPYWGAQEIRNCTSHDINVKLTDANDIAFNDDCEWMVFKPSGVVARCDTEFVVVGSVTVDNNHMESHVTIPIRERRFGEPYNLPDPQDGVLFIVSRIVAEACAGVREDLLIVDDVIRNEQGNPIGCKALARWPSPNRTVNRKVGANYQQTIVGNGNIQISAGRNINTDSVDMGDEVKSEPYFNDGRSERYDLDEADKLLQKVLDNADEADLDDEVYLDSDIINNITAYLSKPKGRPNTCSASQERYLCDDGIACSQNEEAYLNEHDRCGACQAQREYEDDKFPLEE